MVILHCIIVRYVVLAILNYRQLVASISHWKMSRPKVLAENQSS